MKKILHNISIVFFSLGLFFISAVLPAAVVSAQTNSSAQTERLKILKKAFPSSKGCNAENGRNSLRVTFDKSKTVTEVTIFKASDCAEFDQNSIESVRKFKFIPARENGEEITVTKIIEFNWNRY